MKENGSNHSDIHPDVLRRMEEWDRKTGRSSCQDSFGPQSAETRFKIGQAKRKIEKRIEPSIKIEKKIVSEPLTEKQRKWLTDLIEGSPNQIEK